LGRPTSAEAEGSQGAEKLPDLRNDAGVQAIAERTGKSIFQVLLKWGVQRGYVVIPKSSHAEHQKLNLDVATDDFLLTEEEMKYLASKENREAYRICNKFTSFNFYDVFA
jgi:diketogulonate reductase-like aldo/keto reductase